MVMVKLMASSNPIYSAKYYSTLGLIAEHDCWSIVIPEMWQTIAADYQAAPMLCLSCSGKCELNNVVSETSQSERASQWCCKRLW